MEPLKPNLFIVGAPKCGTTFLYDFLESCPDCFLPDIKELNHFSAFDLIGKNSYYKDYKASDIKTYLGHYRKALKTQKYRVDASVSYFNSQTACEAIAKFNPEAKIIIMLRDPIKRAYSHYLMDKRMGFAASSLESYLLEPKSFHYFQYIGNSKYKTHVARYMELFGAHKVLVLDLEKLNAVPILLSSFLEIKVVANNNFESKIVNPNKEAKNIIGKLVLKNRHIVERVKRLVPKPLKNIFLKQIYREAKKEEMSIQEDQILRELLKEDIDFYNDLSSAR